ncbi:hypothetical protein BASA81_013256 [Batrachochytrium salamandrivorans]|nr:hypothetical protein BASA81_013256 [Batrachochytrium salamandrivorans]
MLASWFGQAKPELEPGEANLSELRVIATALESTSDRVSSEHIRRLAEIVLISEQRLLSGTERGEGDAAKCLEVFFSQGLVHQLALLARNNDNTELQIQSLQTLSILAQCLKSDENFFQFLSQNHVNSVIACEFTELVGDREEILAHLVSLIKTLSLRLTEDVIYFFFDGNQFALYDRSVKLFDSPDSLVRATVRSVILQVHLRCLEKCREYITQREYFSFYCIGVKKRLGALESMLVDHQDDRFFLQTVQTGLQDMMDDWAFLGDVLGTMGPNERQVFDELVLLPLLASALIRADTRGDGDSQAVAMWMVAQCVATIPSSASALAMDKLLEGINNKDERLVQACSTICYLLIDSPHGGWKSARELLLAGEEQTYSQDLVQAVLTSFLRLTLLEHGPVRPVTIRLLAKLLVHAAFDSDRIVLSLAHLDMLHKCIAQVAQQLLGKAELEGDSRFVEAFEDEWHELKSHPPLQIQAILINPNSLLSSPPIAMMGPTNLANRLPSNNDELLSSQLQVFLLLRLSQVSLAHSTDHLLPLLGNADVVSVTEDSFLDLRHCKKYFELQVQAKPVNMVLVAGALLLVEPNTGQCRSVCPIHRVQIVPNQMLDDPRVLVISIQSSTRRIGLSTRTVADSKLSQRGHEYRISLRFESEPKSLFAKDHIERSAKRACQSKLKRIKDMLQGYCHAVIVVKEEGG